MKGTRIIAVAAAMVLVAGGFGAFAFHSGGVAECEGCHSMHSGNASALLNDVDASSTCLNCHDNSTGTAPDTGPNGYHISTSTAAFPGQMPLQVTPGGDFGWLKVDFTYTYDPDGTGTRPTEYYTEFGESRGHSIIAQSYGYDVDNNHGATGPGGSFSVTALGCQSCHDPHGKARLEYNGGSFQFSGGPTPTDTLSEPIYTSGSYGSQPKANTFGGTGQASQLAPTGLAVGVYRILYGTASPNKPSNANYGSYPIAYVNSSYNKLETGGPGTAGITRVAYGFTGTNTWGNWCGTCHAAFNVAGGDAAHHPTGASLGGGTLGTRIGAEATNYNAYVSSGVMTGTTANAYNTLVPFESALAGLTPGGLTGLANLRNTLQGANAGSDQVMCLSCHRAHASGFMDTLRYDYGWEFMTYGAEYPGDGNALMTSARSALQKRGRTIAWWQQAYYGRPAASNFGPYDRVLCNKCHAVD